jgi:uncharacterized protein
MDPENKFIADVHLGKLARILRLLGFDTVYKNSYNLTELISISVEQNRILLSRNAALRRKDELKCFVLTDEDPLEQARQVVRHFHLQSFHPFSRCIACNGILEAVDKAAIEVRLQPNTKNYFNEFWQCSQCRRVYWKGSHYERMLKTVKKITS